VRGAGQQRRNHRGDRQILSRRFLRQGDLGAVHTEPGEHEKRDHAEDGEGLAGSGVRERRGDDPSHAGDNHADQGEQRAEVEEEVEAMVERRREKREAQGGEEPLTRNSAVGEE